MSERAKFMLEIAAKYIREHYDEGIIFYDDAECDGACVADDCESASDELHSTLSALREQNRALREALATVRHEICVGPVDDVLWHKAMPAETTVDFICNVLSDDWSYDEWATKQEGVE